MLGMTSEYTNIASSNSQERLDFFMCLSRAVSTLNARQLDILIRHCVFEATFAELSKSYGICIERTRQIYEKTLRILRHPRIGAELRCFLGRKV